MNLSTGYPIEVTILEDNSKATFASDVWMGMTPVVVKKRGEGLQNVSIIRGTCIMFKNGTNINVMEEYETLRNRWMIACGAQA